MADKGEASTARDAPRHSPSGAVGLEHGTVRETLREIPLEIPGFRDLAERGLPPGIVAGLSGEGTSGGTAVDTAPPVGPSEGDGNQGDET